MALIFFVAMAGALGGFLLSLVLRQRQQPPAPEKLVMSEIPVRVAGSIDISDHIEALRISERLCAADITDIAGLLDMTEGMAKQLSGAQTARMILIDAEKCELQYRRAHGDSVGSHGSGVHSDKRPNSRRLSTSVVKVWKPDGVEAWQQCEYGSSLAGRAARSGVVERAGVNTDFHDSFDPEIDGIPVGGAASLYSLLALPFKLRSGTIVGVCVVATIRPPGASEDFSDVTCKLLERFGVAAAMPISNCMRYLKCKSVLELLLRPQKESAKSLEAEMQHHDLRTREYLMANFTALGVAPVPPTPAPSPATTKAHSVSFGSTNNLSVLTRSLSTSLRPAAPDQGVRDLDDLRQLDEKLRDHKQTLLRWELDAWELGEQELRDMLMAMLHSLGLLRRFTISPAALENFLGEVAHHYNECPFHNFRHAFTVTHKAWMFLAHSEIRSQYLGDIECLALMFSAICHDLEHPGTTNAYQVNTRHPLALLYNDSSVLENHHCSTAFGILEQEHCRILNNMPAAEFKAFRKLVVAAILATDMTVHKELLGKVAARLKDGPSPQALPFSRESLDDRQLLVSFLLHCADLSNPLAPPGMSKRIANLVTTEFNRQAMLENEAGLPVSVMTAYDELTKAKMELGFIDFVVRPLYDTLISISPQLNVCLEYIDSTREMWDQLLSTEVALRGGEV